MERIGSIAELYLISQVLSCILLNKYQVQVRLVYFSFKEGLDGSD